MTPEERRRDTTDEDAKTLHQQEVIPSDLNHRSRKTPSSGLKSKLKGIKARLVELTSMSGHSRHAIDPRSSRGFEERFDLDTDEDSDFEVFDSDEDIV